MQPRSRLSAAAAAVGALWFVNGLTTASVAARLPDIAEHLGLTESGLGFALSGQSLGLVVVVALLAPRLVRRFGARPVAVASGVLYGASIVIPGVSPSLQLLFLGFLAVGAFNAPFDVTMADLGGAVEDARGKPTMSAFEAMFVSGQVVGGLLGLALTGAVTARTHLALVAAVAVALVLLAWPALPASSAQEWADESDESNDHAPARGRMPIRTIAWLAAIALGSLWCEGAVVDWVTLLYDEEFEAGRLAAIGLVCFVTAVLVALLLGNRLARAMTPARLMRVGATLFAAGIAITVLAPSIWIASVGLLIAGMGLPNAHPLALSAARKVGGTRALAFVQGVSYVGLVGAKPVIGFLAGASSLRLALGTTVVFAVLIAVGARTLDHRS